MKKWIGLALVAAVAILAIWVIRENKTLECTVYSIDDPNLPEEFDGFRIAQVSDLHSAQFGEKNRQLLQCISQGRPDVIVLTGDIIDSRRLDIPVALEFVREAIQIAPVYCVTGNHEARISEYAVLRDGLEEAGAVVLENEKCTIARQGASITMLGIHDPSFPADPIEGDEAAVTAGRIADLQDPQDGYTVLLSHRPELFPVYVQAGVNLTLTGHVHGGQIRLPGIGGLFGPDQGFFPQYDAGVYSQENTVMIVSRGVGRSMVPVRINNNPELVFVDIRS